MAVLARLDRVRHRGQRPPSAMMIINIHHLLLITIVIDRERDQATGGAAGGVEIRTSSLPISNGNDTGK